MSFGPFLCAAFIACWTVALNSGDATLVRLLQINAAVQVALFALVACVPFLRTGRVSYVDIAWPFGVALLGAQMLAFGDGYFPRRAFVGGAYLLIGLRMGLGAVVMGRKTGVIFKTEFPRYEYRRTMMMQAGTRHMRVHLLAEIMAQAFANISVLALPGFLMATHAAEQIAPLEMVGLGMWALAYVIESIADTQKLLFIHNSPGGVCNVGLWRYSRHPNYFAEWLVWTSLVVAAVPSWLSRQDTESGLVWGTLGLGALGASVMMYVTLVFLTGAKPAEYFSARKREGYTQYQAETSMFFPWFPKRVRPPSP